VITFSVRFAFGMGSELAEESLIAIFG